VKYQWVYHRVLRGQTIWSIAGWYGVTAYQIRVWNKLRSNYLWIGQVLKIYAPIKTQTPAPKTNTPTPPAPNPKQPPAPKPQPKTAPKPVVLYHKVKSGETISGIARKYGTTTSSIMKLNNLKSSNIRVGQNLRVK
jgi:LysM repeat protein